jgi:hypothetical protein
MTKTNFKNVCLVLLMASFLPSLALGAATSSPRFSPKFDKQTICTNMVSRIEKWETNMGNRVDKLQQVRTERQNRFEDRKENWDEKIANKQIENDKHWEEYFAKLEAKAKTDTQKQAVLAFKQAVLAAIQAKRAAVSAANEAFRAAVQQAINQRKESVETLANQFSAEVQAAIQTAKTNCTSGTDPVQVRETLRQAIKAAKDRFQTNRQAIEKIHDDLETARNTHKAAIEQAQETFRTALEAAKNAFRAALKASIPTPSISPTASPLLTPSPTPSVSPSPSPTV